MEKVLDEKTLKQDALDVLKNNDLGKSTKPAPQLYPHQWSWDSAFIAIGLSHSNPSRALTELETLFDAQWKDGRVPHIVFNPNTKDYFPGPDRWNCAALSPAAPEKPATSGLIQPPIHAFAVKTVFDVAPELKDRVRALYPKLVRWHKYCLTERDPEKMGLITIYHPWESGTDNSPRWDSPLKGVKVGEVPPYTRRDTKHVNDPSERPSNEEYDRFLWLVECLKKDHYDDAKLYKTYPFLVKDALMTSIFTLSNHALIELAKQLDAPKEEVQMLEGWQKRAVDGLLEHSWNRQKMLALDLDMERGGAQVDVSTCAGLSPIVVPRLPAEIATKIKEQMFSDKFAGWSDLKFRVIPSTTPGTAGFHPRAYWRGPSWPVISWLYWIGLRQNGFEKEAKELRQQNLDLLEQPEAKFGEYFELTKGTQLGSADQSWTAAVALDWLAS